MSRPLPPLPRYLTAVEAAPVLRMTVAEVVKKCRNRELAATKPGRAWLIAESDLLAYLQRYSNQTETAGDAA